MPLPKTELSAFQRVLHAEMFTTGMTMRDAVMQINQEYNQKVEEIKDSYSFDAYEMQGSRAPWKDVLAVYAVKTTGDPENPQEVASMDEEKVQILSTIYWDMNELSGETETRTVTSETFDDEDETESSTETVLVITISHKTAQEMAAFPETMAKNE